MGRRPLPLAQKALLRRSVKVDLDVVDFVSQFRERLRNQSLRGLAPSKKIVAANLIKTAHEFVQKNRINLTPINGRYAHNLQIAVEREFWAELSSMSVKMDVTLEALCNAYILLARDMELV